MAVPLNRIEIAQRALDALNGGPYLEIGVNTGESFIPIRASRKWGVDPAPVLSWKRRAKYSAFSALGIKFEKIFSMTSDEFFATRSDLLRRHKIDVCFVDGLHTYEQSLRDVLNAAAYLKPGGIILLHDCSPSTELMALPAENIAAAGKRQERNWTGEWSGDVWKSIVHLRSVRRDLRTFVLDCDCGIGVVVRGSSEVALDYREDDIKTMSYDYLAANRKRLLGLEPPQFFEQFLGQHIRQLGMRGDH